MSKKDQTLQVLLDLEWHCTICELPSAQAKTYHLLRQNGWEFDSTSSKGYVGEYFCETCGATTIHRRLLYDHPTGVSYSRIPLTQSERLSIYEYYQYTEAFDHRVMPKAKMEIDHRFPQIRWSMENHLPYSSFEHNFMLLTRTHNLAKSRDCEHCFKSGERASPMGIEFWYEGDKHWRHDQCDPQGCVGCFWHDPFEWRNQVNTALQNFSESIKR